MIFPERQRQTVKQIRSEKRMKAFPYLRVPVNILSNKPPKLAFSTKSAQAGCLIFLISVLIIE